MVEKEVLDDEATGVDVTAADIPVSIRGSLSLIVLTTVIKWKR